MGVSLRALRAVVIACGLACLWPAAGRAAALQPAVGFDPAGAAEPFGLSVFSLDEGALHDKWQKLARQLDDDRVQLALCDGDRDNCVSPAALRLLAIVDAARQRQGRARLGEINRAINLAIRPMSDLAQYGEIDVWTSPLQTFGRGAGDCEDYAIAKLAALRQAGIEASDLRLLILRDTISGEDHAVAAARLEGRWLMLDNTRMAMVEDVNARNVRPLFAIDQTGIMKYSGMPLLASGKTPAAPAEAAAQPGLIAASE